MYTVSEYINVSYLLNVRPDDYDAATTINNAGIIL